ncbi:peptidase family M13 [Drepanopeziza brunnea f. sp. 'multigermtubi' MB_m1]|uniref:Peptidase family M13 n=1 Tax=Marssonina brunnea f. sp. multigermtubi (strain MB_m1) TaxID=1072389 RepID=K1WMJ4_MARBU|nr:peptidase family M13 [Drepanopeziza brunnea f. sp. 'multigermtubi' MB_m1]EKD14071.1 peptidase family M13 [Drepanopeziza brunnea f. sp. 'multigermtubi' MB_m1]
MARGPDADERVPLLSNFNTNSKADDARPKKAARWLARHAVVIFMSLLLLAIIIVLCVFFGTYRSKKTPSKSSVCVTPACIHASSEILYNLSPDYKDIDPCDNFEDLVCGGWGDRHDLRPDQGDAFTGTIMQENSQMLLRHILEAPYPEESKHSSFSPAQLLTTLSSVDQQNFGKLKAAYDACMDEDTIKNVGPKPLQEILHQVADLYPSTESALRRRTPISAEDSKDLGTTMTYLTKLGIPALLSFGAGADDKNPDSVAVQASPPWKIGLPAKELYSDTAVIQKYEDVIAEVLAMLHPDHSHENVTLHAQLIKSSGYGKIASIGHSQEFAHEIVEFEKKLAAASPDAEDAVDVTKYYNPMSIKDADALTPQIHLAMIVKELEPADVKTNRIIVASPSYQKNLTKILSSSSKEVLQTYFMWKAIQAFSSMVESEALLPYTKFVNELQGKDADSTQDRWRTCVGHVDDGLGWILSRFFVEKAFSEKAKKLGDQIVSDIKETFIEKLRKTDWMDKSVIDLAIEKVHKIVQKIGYPTKSPEIMDPSALHTYYQTINITPTTFFQNALSMSRFQVAHEWSSLGKPVDRDEWGMTVPTVNAYYNPPGNEIVFPAGIMQFPVFDASIPQYVSYGAFGSVSGHELSHAFDSTGRHYDQNGNYTDWWTNNTVEGFETRAECFIDQYHKYTVPGPDERRLHVNGKLTLGENIADAGGITAAFGAWQKRRAETPNQDLPGLDFFSQEQLFFVSYANWWCGKSRKETAINRIYTDPHAPKWARILGTMANSRDFKDSFKCMDKKPTCELW